MNVNQADLAGGLLFIAMLGMAIYALWWLFQDDTAAKVCETSDEDPRYESEEQAFPMDEAAEDWEYVTEFVDPDIPAKRSDDPLPSDVYVVEKNGLGEYRSVEKPNWVERVRSGPDEWEMVDTSDLSDEEILELTHELNKLEQ